MLGEFGIQTLSEDQIVANMVPVHPPVEKGRKVNYTSWQVVESRNLILERDGMT